MKWFISFTLMICSFYVTSSKIFNLTDSDFESLTKRGESNPWLVMFYVSTCHYCKLGNQMIEKAAKLTEKDGDNISYGRIECNENIYECLRFNITKVPTIIIIDKGYFFEESNYLTETSLINFIKSEKEVEKGRQLPPVFGYLQFFMRSLQETMIHLNKYMKEFSKNKLGVDIDWGNGHSMILFAGLFVVTFIIEFYLFTLCLKKKKTVKDQKQNKIDDHQNVNEKKEEQKPQEKTEEIDDGKEKKE